MKAPRSRRMRPEPRTRAEHVAQSQAFIDRTEQFLIGAISLAETHLANGDLGLAADIIFCARCHLGDIEHELARYTIRGGSRR